MNQLTQNANPVKNALEKWTWWVDEIDCGNGLISVGLNQPRGATRVPKRINNAPKKRPNSSTLK
jgi:hypothetical protein